MICLGILWNSMDNYSKKVLEDISSYGNILDVFSINLGDKYEQFVRDIYSQDEIAEWKVNKKIETMFKCSNSRKITIVTIDIETLKTEYHPYKKRIVFTNLEKMKTDIRKKYSEMIDYYFFDNVFHVTDDENEYIADLSVVNNYLSLGLIKETLEQKEDVKSLKKEYKNEIRRENN